MTLPRAGFDWLAAPLRTLLITSCTSRHGFVLRCNGLGGLGILGFTLDLGGRVESS